MATGYRLGEWTVRPHRNRIERGSDSIHLAPKAMAVLDRLASASNSVVTRQELFDCVWPGAAITDETLTQRIAELRKAFEDSARQSKVIETIPKVGFRLIPPVIPLSGEPMTRQGLHRAGKPEIQEPPANVENPTIAVLPFLNLSQDPGNEFFSDGISEELINLLVKVPGLDVISRTSSFSFKGESWKIADLARELNASLIVEGTVRKVDNRVRITAQLIDPATDRHLCSEIFDRKLSDIFALQEEIAQSIVTALRDEIGAHTVTSPRPSRNLEAYELFLAGRYYFYQRGAAMDKAIRVLQMAVEKDPEFAEAWAYLAAVATVTWVYQTAISNEQAMRIARHASRKALELDPRMGLALAAQAMGAYGWEGNLQKGFHLIDRAADEYPHDTTIRLWAGMYHHHWGYLEEAHSHFLYAYKHNPRVGITNGMLAQIYLEQGREELAAPRLAKATELGWPQHIYTQAGLHMMRGEFNAAFAFLKVAFADPGTDSDPLPWIHDLEKAGRSHVENQSPASADALISVVERVPRSGVWGQTYLYLIFNLKERFFAHFSATVRENHFWSMLMMVLWLPEFREFVEDPRFFEIMRGDGALALWEQRGFPDGCLRVQDSSGEHLDCSGRYR